MALIQLPFVVASDFHRYPLAVSVVATCFLLVLGLGFIAWGFAIRRRYHRYIGYIPEHAQSQSI
jgi:hypothetical protein